MEKRELSESEKGTEHVVRSGSRLTIETIAEFVQQIRKALNEASTVVIEFDRDVEMDITALQVFYASCKQAAIDGKHLIRRGPEPQTMLDLVAAAGAERHGQCGNNSITCFRRFGGGMGWEN